MKPEENIKDRSLARLFIALNVGLALAFAGYLIVSRNSQPKAVPASFNTAVNLRSNSTLASLQALAAKTNAPAVTSAPPAVVAAPTHAAAPTNLVDNVATSAPPPRPTFTQRKYTWQDVEGPDYTTYLASLRAVGCPEERVRSIALADINELFDRQRIKEAVAQDMQWWRAGPEYMVVNVLQEKGRQLEEQRRQLIAKHLGTEVSESEKGEAALWSSVQLTGPVLGALPLEKHNQVQEICSKSMERHQSAMFAVMNAGQPYSQNSVDMAKLREMTRADLRQVLSPEELEEFLLRYSHNSQNLRMELSAVNPNPEEFRKVFRSTDALDHRMQLDFGSTETMSPQQRERHERQRDAAIRETLGPKRYQDYLMTKDPLYRDAQLHARRYNAPADVVMPIYQMTKVNEAKKRTILSDATLSQQEQREKLQAVAVEQEQSILRIISEAATRR